MAECTSVKRVQNNAWNTHQSCSIASLEALRKNKEAHTETHRTHPSRF